MEQVIPGTERDGTVTGPVFSPDGRWLTYHGASASDNAIRRIPIEGGVPTTIVRTGSPTGMSWDERGIVYSGNAGEGIFRVSPNGGAPERLARLDDKHLAWGPHLLDNCNLEALAEAAAARKRWECLLTAAPLPIRGGTGSPVPDRDVLKART